MLTVVERNHNPAATTADTAPIRLMTRHTRVAIGEIIPVAIAVALTHRIENLKTGDHQLDRYQNHDDDLQAQRPSGVDRIGHDLGSIGDDGELA